VETAPPTAEPPDTAGEAAWPAARGRPLLFLLDASSPLEHEVLSRWIRDGAPPHEVGSMDSLPIPPSRRRRREAVDPRLEARLARDDDPLCAPLRVAWLPSEKGGERVVRFRDLLAFSDPRDPGRLRQRLVVARDGSRCRVVAGEPALASELRERWREAGGTDTSATMSFPEFVARQAALALERAERRLRGARYKVPKLVHEEILDRPAFRGGLAALAGELGRSEASLRSRASRYLREIAATHSPFVIDLVVRLIRLLYRQGYRAIHHDREKLEAVAALAQRHPVVFLPSHKSNLDHLVLQYVLHQHGMPPNHTAGGINMNFFPIGPLVRRSGIFFIRRSFKDDALYKHVLRSYVDYLIEKRFPLEWYIEGGRSRTGKLLPPRFGMLAYVVDAFRRGKSDDVHLIPVSIAYDQIQEVGSYADEQTGGAKRKESFGWFVGVVRAMRRPYGEIHIHFGEPVSLREALGAPRPGAPPDPDERSLDLQKLAFEVSVRINRATPVTTTSFVVTALLGTGERALTVPEVREGLAAFLRFVQERKLPETHDLGFLSTDEGVRQALDALRANGVLSRYDGGREPVYRIGPEQQLPAAYYRNNIVHFFVNGAIAEVALLEAGERPGPERLDAFWRAAYALRDLLKFDFFFAERDAFRREIEDELRFREAAWPERLAEDPERGLALVRDFEPYMAHRVLRPFLDAYRVVASELVHRGDEPVADEKALLRACLGLGVQYQLQERIHSTSSISKGLFEAAVRLAEHRGLLARTGEGVDLADARRAFEQEVRAAGARVGRVVELAARRREALLAADLPD